MAILRKRNKLTALIGGKLISEAQTFVTDRARPWGNTNWRCKR